MIYVCELSVIVCLIYLNICARDKLLFLLFLLLRKREKMKKREKLRKEAEELNWLRNDIFNMILKGVNNENQKKKLVYLEKFWRVGYLLYI